jgi:tetratricopeptide (TPR) repeat protein
LFVALPVRIASSQGGGVDGGGGGGKMVPGRDEDGSTLSEVFREGVAFLADGKCKKAEDKFQFVLKTVPRNSQANYLRGIALQCQKRYNSSIRYFKRAKRDDAQFYQAYGGLGISYLALGKPARARDERRRLGKFMRLCQRKNRICPPELLKTHKKLTTAIERAEGGVRDSKGDDRHGLFFDHDSNPLTNDLASATTLWHFDQNPSISLNRT